MIIRLSQKLAKKIDEPLSQSLPLDANPYADWSAHLFTAERVQFILVTNTASLYSMVMYGKGSTTDSQLIRRILNYMNEFIRDDGHEFLLERLVLPSTASIAFSKALNRGVTGSMNDMVTNAKYLLIERELSPYDVSFELNEMPMSYIGYGHPRDAFVKLRV